MGCVYQAQNSAHHSAVPLGLMVAARAWRDGAIKEKITFLKICERHDAILAGDNRARVATLQHGAKEEFTEFRTYCV